MKVQIEETIVKTLIAIEPFLVNLFNIHMGGTRKPNKRCFQILGIDILIDDTLKPWLLEINGKNHQIDCVLLANPSLSMQFPQHEADQ